VIHDRVYVNLIYDVATEATQNEKTANIKGALREIQANLETPENLSPSATQVLQAIVAQGLPLSPGLIDDLLDNIHTQLGIKERFRDGVVRSGRYVEQFRQIMTNQGVPSELALLPLVESSFQNVRSKAGAVGVWQFTSGTGRSYLRITSKVDERLDPVRSSEAAARLLRDNYSALGAWPLAITAYNHGRGGMLAAQKEHGSDLPKIIDEYRGPVFGYASMNFYSEFLAAVEIYENYPQYFGELALERSDSIPQNRPTMSAAKAPAKAAPATAASKYKVRSGDTLFEIAQRFGTSIATLMDKNNLNKPVIYAGQILLVK
jgi:membrane-bound lytic murein transglycosylase D